MHFIHVGEADRFSVVAVMSIDGAETIVGEARYAFDADTDSFEFGLSIDDRWQGHGVGSALLRNLECRAAAFGANRLFGDTLRSNDAMLGLARKSGFAFTQFARRLEAGAVRKAHRRRAAGNSLRQLAARRAGRAARFGLKLVLILRSIANGDASRRMAASGSHGSRRRESASSP